MIEVVARVDAPEGAEQGIKEKLAMDYEKYGDVRIVAVRAVEREQMRMEAMGG